MATRKPKTIPPPVATLEQFVVHTGLRRRKPISEAEEEQLSGQARYCSFCGKGNLEVETMIVAPDAIICGDCVDLCRDIVGAHRVKLSCGSDASIYENHNGDR